MSYTLKLDTLSHDLKIKNHRFVMVNGSDEVRQRIKIALWHEYGEYFMAPWNGIPWYSEILGSKMDRNTIQNLLRQKISKIPGVVQVEAVRITKKIRDYAIDVICWVESGPNEQSTKLTVSDLRIGE